MPRGSAVPLHRENVTALRQAPRDLHQDEQIIRDSEEMINA